MRMRSRVMPAASYIAMSVARLRRCVACGVVGEARVDLGRDAARDDLEDLEAELDREAVDRALHDVLGAAALGRLACPDERVVDELRVRGHRAAAVMSDGFVVASRGLNFSIELMSPVSATTTVTSLS